MSDPVDEDDPGGIGRFVADDVRTTLERYFPADEPESPDLPRGYVPVESFGLQGEFRGTDFRNDKAFRVFRWRWHGRHEPGDADPTARAGRPTGNNVEVNGLTIVEPGSTDDDFTIRRFVDWLSVYAQLGIVFEGRPIGLAQTEVRAMPTKPPDEPTEAG